MIPGSYLTDADAECLAEDLIFTVDKNIDERLPWKSYVLLVDEIAKGLKGLALASEEGRVEEWFATRQL